MTGSELVEHVFGKLLDGLARPRFEGCHPLLVGFSPPLGILNGYAHDGGCRLVTHFHTLNDSTSMLGGRKWP